MFLPKKGMSAIIAISLILIVAVLSVLGFQKWYLGFQSKSLAESEDKSSLNSLSSRIETISGNTLYFHYGGKDLANYTQIRVGNITCSTQGVLSSGINSLNLSNCDKNITSGAHNILLITTQGVYNKKVVVNSVIAASNQSSDVPQTYEELILSHNPVAYWRFDESSGTSAADSSGNGLSGTYLNSPQLGSSSLVSGEGSSVSLNGVNQVVRVSDNDLLDFNGNLSLEIWINWTSSSSNTPLISKWGGAAPPTSYVLNIYPNAGRPSMSVYGGNTLQTSNAINDGNAHHVVGTYNSTHLRLYIDGVEVLGSPLASSNTITTDTFDLYIGSYSTGGPYFAGQIDEAAIYDYILSPQQILSHYDKGTQ